MDFKKLAKEVADARIGRSRLTDLEKGTYTLAIDPKSETSVHLVSTKKVKTPISINSLAAMRIVTSAADAIKVATTADARGADGYKTLQDAINNDGAVIDETTKFEVVHKLRIKDSVTGELVYKNEHYKNYPEYVKESRKAANITVDAERNTAFTTAAENLRSGGLKTPKPAEEDKNLVMMPVFIVSN